MVGVRAGSQDSWALFVALLQNYVTLHKSLSLPTSSGAPSKKELITALCFPRPLKGQIN